MATRDDSRVTSAFIRRHFILLRHPPLSTSLNKIIKQKMATITRKRPRWQTALDMEDLRTRLSDVDESNPDDLLAFKRALQAVVTDIPSVCSLPTSYLLPN